MTDAEGKYPSIIEDVRRNLGLKPDDSSRDAEILVMPRAELLKRFLTWNGIIGYDDTIKSVVGEICEVGLKERQ